MAIVAVDTLAGPAGAPGNGHFRKRSFIARLVPCLLGVALIGLASSCASTSAQSLPAQQTPSPVAHAPSRIPVRIAVIVMENTEYGQLIGSPTAPYINALVRRYGLARQMYAVTHPSLPNYLALTGGSTFGITDDCTGCVVRAPNLVDQLERAHVSWKAYMEDLPYPCFRGPSAGDYAKKHDPFMYYADVAGSAARCRRVVPLNALAGDERPHSLSRFVWITPNLCHDMHDCDTATGDRFLARLMPGLIRAMGQGGLVILTWDEGTSDDGCCRVAAGGHIATIVAGPAAAPGGRLKTPVDHYSVLQTIEDLLGLPRLRRAACACTPSLAALLRRG